MKAVLAPPPILGCRAAASTDIQCRTAGQVKDGGTFNSTSN